MTLKPTPSQAFGLYIHIPFCDRLCHYCDFVKTAWHEPAEQKAYLTALQNRLQNFLSCQDFPSGGQQPFASLFLGGGTPSVLDRAYEALFAMVRPYLSPGAEVSLEANPEHITAERMRIWKDFGINRLSLGVQSFQDQGLRFLTRTHSAKTADIAVETALSYLDNVNIDLIYAWPGQSAEDWQADVQHALDLGVSHLSLYGLTFEGRTPMARRVQRGVLDPMADETQDAFFQMARQQLSKHGWRHEEVSNWARPGFESFHNAIYWAGGSYLGLGAGAHSYLSHLGPWGLRFHQDANWKKFIRQSPIATGPEILDLLRGTSYQVEDDRDAEAWIAEQVSSGLRSSFGINVAAICAKTGYIWDPRPAIQMALDQGTLGVDSEGWYRLDPGEWYRETRWSLEFILSFRLDTNG